MRQSEYLILLDRLYDGKFGITSLMRNNIMKKVKANEVNIDLLIIYNNEIMRITPYEIDFLCIEYGSRKYNTYHDGEYDLLWLRFVPNCTSFAPQDQQMWEMNILKRFHYTWYNPLRKTLIQYKEEINKPILLERERFKIYPDQSDILAVFQVPINQIRVVVVGQDPYPAGNHANGIAFATKQDVIPASLKMIEQGIKTDYSDLAYPIDGSLTHLLKQGVFLLNTSLTVREMQPNSHVEIWKSFIDKVITLLTLKKQPIVFCLLGSEAKRYSKLIQDSEVHSFIEVEHPAYAVREKRVWEHQNLFKRVDDKLNIKIKWLQL